MPRIDRPSPLDVFVCVRSGINQVVEATCVVEYPEARPDQWTAIFPDNSRINWNTSKWRAFDAFHPKDWIRTGAYYYPADCVERFPEVKDKETFKAYWERVKLLKLEGMDKVKEADKKTIFEEKSGRLAEVKEKEEKIKKARAANPKKNYPPVALPG